MALDKNKESRSLEDKRITQLDPLPVAANNDVFPIVDVSELTTKKISKHDLLANPGPIGTGTAAPGIFTSLKVSLGTPINEFSIDPTLSGNSDSALPTEKAVKTYVDAIAENTLLFNIRHISSDSTAIIGDVLLIDSTTGNITITIMVNPASKGMLILKKISNDENVIKVKSTTGQIDQNGFVKITQPFKSEILICDGANVFIV